MKVMAGYDTRSKVDYRAKAAEEVAKIQQKARLLEERLASFQPGEDTMKDGDVFEELASALSSAQPKIQKMCEEESDDHEAVARLLEINDSIHRTVERYKLLKKGDYEAASKIAAGEPLPSTSGQKASAAQELSLIDFDGGDAAPANGGTSGSAAAAQAASGVAGIESDLLGLSFNEPATSYSQVAPGGIALGFGANNSVPGPALLSSVTQNSTARGLPNTPPPPASSAFSSLFPTASATAASSQRSTPQPNYQSSAFAPPNAGAAADPFAALASPKFKLSASSSPAPAAAAAATATATATAAADDDEWSFSSALPPDATSAKPKEHRAVIGSGPVKIDLYATRAPAEPAAIRFAFAFSNTTPQPVADLHFQTAVTKVCFPRPVCSL